MVIFANEKTIEIKKIRGSETIELLVTADKDVKVCRPGTIEKVNGEWRETEESKARRK